MLNVLIGPNASGKTNLLRSLELLQEAATGDLDGAIVRQGGIQSVLWDGQATELGWEIDVDPAGFFSYGSRQVTDIRYELLLRPYSITNYFRVEREFLADCSPPELDGRKYRFKYLERDRNGAVLFDQKGEKVEAAIDKLEETKTLLSQTSNLLSSSDVSLFFGYLRNWKIYQDLDVAKNSPVRQAVITRKETRLSPTGQDLVTVLHTLYTSERYFRHQVDDAMRAAFGKNFESLEFPPAEDQRIQMRVRWKSLSNAHSSADLSEGTLRFLMLVAILANRGRGWLIAIDEPETYLHPSMFPIIAELATEAADSTQIIFTTHSPEFLTALGVKAPRTGVLQNVNGETQLSILDEADLQKWLARYKLGELFVSGELEALT